MRDDSFERLLDFLLWNEENAKIICSFIDDLTAEGFEHYISEYYKQIYGFTTVVNGGFHDKWIDVKGLRIDENGTREHLIVQCKKWNWAPKWTKDKYYIWENLISQFYGKVADIKNSWNVRLVYATTKDVTPWAKIFCQEKNIDLITFKELLDFNDQMNLWEWITATLESSIPQIKKQALISQEYIERRNRFLEEKKIITENTMTKIALEKSKTADYDRYANFDKTRLVIKRIENTNKDVQLKKSWFSFLGFTVLALVSLFIFWILGIAYSAYRSAVVDKIKDLQNAQIITTNNTQATYQNKKRNTQKSVHNIVSQ